MYCENPQKEDDGYTTPEENIRIFLSDSLSSQNFRWRTSSTRPPIFDKPICKFSFKSDIAYTYCQLKFSAFYTHNYLFFLGEKELIQSLVFDAKATSVDYKKCFEKTNIKYDE